MRVGILALAIIGVTVAGASRVTVAAQQAPAAGSGGSVWDGVFSAEQAKRGEAVYTQECSMCHGGQMEGLDASPPLSGPMFTSNWNDLSVGDLFERIRISMPQDNPGKLSREQDADVVSYILAANKFPEGEKELPTELPALKQIKIEAKK